MSISPVTNGTNSAGTAPAPQAATLGKQDFLQLLVMQLKNQDPLNPIDNREFIAQMAQLSSLEATNKLSSQVGDMVATEQQMSALQLVGRDVKYSDGQGGSVRGHVSGVRFGDSSPMLQIGSTEVPMGLVQTVL